MPLPGTSFKSVDPDSFEELPTGEAEMILISGPQIMQGYLNDADRTAKALHVIDANRWYITGDKDFIDEDGFLTLIDRYARFAKIGGEMISLSAFEAALEEPDNALMAVSIPDSRKGERIVLLSETALDANTVKAAMLVNGASSMMIPSH